MLLEPFAFANGVRAKNRVALAALTNRQSHLDGSLSDAELAWLERRAAGGFGLVFTCAAHVSPHGQGWAGELGIFDDRLLPGLTRLAQALSAHGALPLVQIFHGGARAPEALIGQRPWSASESPEDPSNPRAATEDDIAGVIADFRAAAVRAWQAGFAGVELHGAHGYLLGQFLSATQNRRTDVWGLERDRLLRTVLREVRAAVPAEFIVGVRLSPEDFGQAKGLDLDESLALAPKLAAEGADYLHLSLWDVTRNSTKRPEQHPITLFREAVPGVPLMVAGKVWTLADAEACEARGATFVALGRAGIANPDWPLHAAREGWEPVRPPVTREHLLASAVSPGFVEYLGNFKGFIAP